MSRTSIWLVDVFKAGYPMPIWLLIKLCLQPPSTKAEIPANLISRSSVHYYRREMEGVAAASIWRVVLYCPAMRTPTPSPSTLRQERSIRQVSLLLCLSVPLFHCFSVFLIKKITYIHLSVSLAGSVVLHSVKSQFFSSLSLCLFLSVSFALSLN